MKTCYNFPRANNWETLPLMQEGDVFQRLKVIAVDNGRKLVIVGDSDSPYIDNKRTEPIDVKAWRFVEEGRKGKPRRLKTILACHAWPLFRLVSMDGSEWGFYPWERTKQDLRFCVEGTTVTATQSAEVLEREKAIIKAEQWRKGWKDLILLVLVSIVFMVVGFYLLMFVWFIGTLFKEVF